MNPMNVFYEKNTHSVHAEVNCIRKCRDKKILKKSTLIIIKIKHNNITYCEPCEICWKYIRKHGVKTVKSINIDK